MAALSEIAESHPNSNLLDLNPQTINKLLTALNECTEWGQIFILDCLANYTPRDDRESQRWEEILYPYFQLTPGATEPKCKSCFDPDIFQHL